MAVAEFSDLGDRAVGKPLHDVGAATVLELDGRRAAQRFSQAIAIGAGQAPERSHLNL